MGAQRLLHVVVPLDILRVVQIADIEQLLQAQHALFGERRALVLFIDGVVAGGVLLARLLALDDFAARQLGNDAVDLVILVGGFLAGTGNDQRGARFVDQDRVHLVDDGVVVYPLHAVLDAELHVVAQVVEPELVVGAVGDVGVVGVLALLVVQIVHDHTDLEAEKLVEPPHPLRVAAGQVIVDRNHVNAVAGQRVQVARQGGDQRLAFTGFHFGDLALVEHHAANQLNVEMTHVQHAAAGLADHGEGRNQEVVKRRALSDLLFKFNGFRSQVDVGEFPQLGFQRADCRHCGQHGFHFTFGLRSEDFGQSGINNGHVKVSFQEGTANTILLCKERRPLKKRLSAPPDLLPSEAWGTRRAASRADLWFFPPWPPPGCLPKAAKARTFPATRCAIPIR